MRQFAVSLSLHYRLHLAYLTRHLVSQMWSAVFCIKCTCRPTYDQFRIKLKRSAWCHDLESPCKISAGGWALDLTTTWRWRRRIFIFHHYGDMEYGIFDLPFICGFPPKILECSALEPLIPCHFMIIKILPSLSFTYALGLWYNTGRETMWLLFQFNSWFIINSMFSMWSRMTVDYA